MSWERLFTRPILVVSGKGGTGKSTMAAALATAATRSGRRVLLAEVEGRGQVAATLGVPDPGFKEEQTPDGFAVLSITPQAAAAEYLHLYFGMDRVARALIRAGVLDQLIGTVPGFRDLLACGKLYEITHVRRTSSRDRGRPGYDLLVVDGPPTGQIGSFLAAPATFADLIRVGRMKRQAANIHRMLREQAQVVLVSLPDEMSVAETLEALPAIAETRIRIASVVANRVLPPVLPRGTRAAFQRLGPSDVVKLCGDAELSISAETATRLLEQTTEANRHRADQASFVQQLDRAGPTFVLPEVELEPGRAAPPALVEALAGRIGQTEPGPDPAGGNASDRHPWPTPDSTEPDARGGSLDEHLGGARIVVVCGSGGVGKTTISAAVATRLAERGTRTVLLTVDPAKRLATALRLPFAPGERTVLRFGGGRKLEAMQLDTQRTFDRLIERHAGTPARAERILTNAFYRRMADTLAGTSEYMAMEQLYELAVEEAHDAIVIDTPPTRSALSFLDAPNRLTDFLGGRLLRWMLWPSARAGRLTMGVARRSAGAFARIAGGMVGAEVLGDIADFLAAFEGMYGGFKERAGRVLELLRSPECSFVVVTTPATPSLDEAAFFVQRLAESRMHAAAVVANRWHVAPTVLEPGAPEAAMRLARGTAAQRAVAAVLTEQLRLGPRRHAETSAMAAFGERHPGVPVIGVPELPGDVHDVPGLRRIGDALFGVDQPERRPLSR